MMEEMIRAARQGNRQAVGELLQRSAGALRELAVRELCRRQVEGVDATELVQRTLQIADKDFAHFAGSCEEQLLPWLGGIMRCHIDQGCRHSPAESSGTSQRSEGSLRQPETGSLAVPNRSSHPAGDGESLLAAINLLPAVPRDVVRLRMLRGWTIVRLATHLGLEEVTVAGLLRQGLRRLCEILEAEDRQNP